MLNRYKPIRFYALFVLFVLGVFTWATLTGTRLLGDDKESVENRGAYGSSGSSSGSRARFYHK